MVSKVFIPIPFVESTQQHDQSGQLMEAYSLPGQSIHDDKAFEKKWEPITIHLRPKNLDKDGNVAVSKLRKLTLSSPLLAVSQHLSKNKHAWLENQRLHVDNHSQNCEGNSAQLGMALALLLNGSNSPIHYAIATGSFEKRDEEGDSPLGNLKNDNDVPIECVNSIPEKLDLIIKKRKANVLPNTALFCFTPKYYKKEGAKYLVSELEQIRTLKQANIEVRPIEWLSEAQQILKASTTKATILDKQLGACLSGIAAMILLMLAYLSWLNAFIPIEADKTLKEPVLVCKSRDSKNVIYHALKYDGGVPNIPLYNQKNLSYQMGIGIKLIPQKTFLSDKYYVAFFNLGEKSKPFFIPDSRPVDAGKALQKNWVLADDNNIEEENYLIITFQRTKINNIKLTEINDDLNRWYQEKARNINVAKEKIINQFPGSYIFYYKSILEDSPC